MEEVAKQIYIETTYDEINVGAIVTPTGVICVDVPSYARDARDWAARMHRLSPYPVQNIILTDACGDRILNTRWLNAPIIMHQAAADRLKSYDKKYPQSLLESLAIRNPHRGRELSNGPVEHATASFSGEIVIYRHGLTIELKHAGGPTRGNAWVCLPQHKVIFAGDTLMLDRHPHSAERSTQQWIDSLQEMLKLVDTHTVVPGRGNIVTKEGIQATIEYLQMMFETVTAYVEAEQSRESLSTLVPNFLNLFPIGAHPIDWVRDQVENSLGNMYDEVKSGVESEEQYQQENIVEEDQQ